MLIVEGFRGSVMLTMRRFPGVLMLTIVRFAGGVLLAIGELLVCFMPSVERCRSGVRLGIGE